MSSTMITIAVVGNGYYLGTGPAGTYTVTISADGYESNDFSDVVIPVGGVINRNFGLDPTITKGSINGDSVVDMADAILALQVLSGIESSSIIYKQADVNDDNKIGLEEIIYILQEISELR